MGLYPAICTVCSQPFIWFSGDSHQVCPDCLKNFVDIQLSNSSPKKENQNEEKAKENTNSKL